MELMQAILKLILAPLIYLTAFILVVTLNAVGEYHIARQIRNFF